MVKCQPIREIMREINTTYFHEKNISLYISLVILGPSGSNVKLVIDRDGSRKMINQFSELNCEEPGKSLYYGYYNLQYTDYYMVEADKTCEIQVWREIESEKK